MDCLVRRASDGHDLVERLFGADHTQIGARTFFGSLGALLEVYDLGVEGVIALSKLRILLALLGNSSAQITRLAETFGCEPQLTLQCQRSNTQQDEHPT